MKKLSIIILILFPIIVLVVWCGIVIRSLGLGICDSEGYLTDQKTEDELFAALTKFRIQHKVYFDYSGTSPTCNSGVIKAYPDYTTAAEVSKYGIRYTLGVLVTYSPESRNVTLEISDNLSETNDSLNYIYSLNDVITKFENTPQIEEFITTFQNEGVKIFGTLHEDDMLWIETDPSLHFPQTDSLLSADIFYSTSTASITSYSLPNRITWHNFPGIPVIHEILNNDLLVDELSDCAISTKKVAFANTDVNFNHAPSIRVGVKITCSDIADDPYLRLILHPDGSYESEGVK